MITRIVVLFLLVIPMNFMFDFQIAVQRYIKKHIRCIIFLQKVAQMPRIYVFLLLFCPKNVFCLAKSHF